MVTAPLRIRSAVADDLEPITRLYNHYVRHTAITFDVEPFAPEARRAWLAQFATSGPHRLLVAEDAGRVVGYAGSSRFRAKAAYDPSVETTVYLEPGATGRGIGARLYAALLESLAREDVHRAYAGVTLPNPASVALHLRLGFREVGVYREVGRKLGRWWDVQWYEKAM